MNNNYIIWCTYHNINIPKEYNLYESEHFKLFYNDDLNTKEDNINYLHDYLCELSTYYYVWKNNLKSDIVGFCHYSKQFKYIDYERLEKFGYDSIGVACYKSNDMVINVLKQNTKFLYLNAISYFKYKYNINLFQYSQEHEYMLSTYHNVYLFKWDVFCDVCDFIFGFLNYIFPNELWKIKSNLDFIVKLNNLNENEIFSQTPAWFTRHISIFYEWLIGLYLGIKYVNNTYEQFFTDAYYEHLYKYAILCEDYIDTVEDAKTWIKQNVKTGVTHYAIKSHNPQKIKDVIYFPWAGSLLNVYHHYLDIYETDEEYNEHKITMNNDGFIEICLHKDERVHCDTSIEMHKGNYYIEKIK